MKNATKGGILKGTALTLDVSVPLLATLSQFPAWIEESAEASVSGLFMIFAILSAIPFIKQIRAYLRNPSAWVMWLVLFAILVVLRNIIDQMVIVCFAGAVANVIGAGIYNLGKFVESRPDKERDR